MNIHDIKEEENMVLEIKEENFVFEIKEENIVFEIKYEPDEDIDEVKWNNESPSYSGEGLEMLQSEEIVVQVDVPKIKRKKKIIMEKKVKKKIEKKVKKKIEKKFKKKIEKEEITSKENFVCDKCGRVYLTKTILAAHQRRKNCSMQGLIAGAETAICDFCSQLFISKVLLERHILYRHFGIKKYRCGICHKRYMTKDYLKVHLLSHEGITKYNCKICGHGSIYSSQHNDHMKLKHELGESVSGGVAKFSCRFCPKKFVTYCGFKRHEEKHMGRHFECDLCENPFSSKQALEQHILLIHFGIKQFACQLCDKSFSKKCSLKYHLLDHTGEKKPYQCELCLKEFVIKAAYEMHVVTHDPNTPLKCPICKQKCRNEENLDKHVRHHAEHPELYTCQYCSRVLKTVFAKKLHVRKVHGEDGSKLSAGIPCSFHGCSRTLASRKALQVHLLAHRESSGGTCCMICLAYFKTYHEFYEHIPDGHRNIQRMPLNCWVCLQGFLDELEYRSHLLIKHQIVEKKKG